MGEVLAALVAGVAGGVPLFTVASGLTLIYGVMRVLNFAHGALFAMGAFVLASVLGGAAPSIGLLVLGLLVAAVAVAAVGGLSEALVFRKLYARDHTTTLLASYALLLTLGGLSEQIWGVSPRSQAQAGALSGSVSLGGIHLATYDLVLIGIGLLLATGLTVLLQRTPFGLSVRAVAQDETMARALGVRARRVQLPVFALGSGLAGLAGALIAPLVSIEPGLAPSFVVQSFAVVIIGGLASIPGALLAALLIGILDSFAVSFAPSLVGFSLYVGVAVVLLVRPQGLLGRPADVREA